MFITNICLIVFANNIAESNEELKLIHNDTNSKNIIYTSSQQLFPINQVHQNKSTLMFDGTLQADKSADKTFI